MASDLTNGLIMAAVCLAIGIAISIGMCFYINTLENNTDKPKDKIELEDNPTQPIDPL